MPETGRGTAGSRHTGGGVASGSGSRPTDPRAPWEDSIVGLECCLSCAAQHLPADRANRIAARKQTRFEPPIA